MVQKIRPLAQLCLLTASVGLILAGEGCATRPPDELAQAVETGESPIAMKGTGVFFSGKLGVAVTISRGIGHGTGGHKHTGTELMPSSEGMNNDEAVAYMRAKIAVGSPLPPVTLRLMLDNRAHGSPLLVEVLDFESDLGNFAVHPAVLALAQDQTAQPDPMISQLGVTSDEIPVKVTLRLDGVAETQTILVRNLLETTHALPK